MLPSAFLRELTAAGQIVAIVRRVTA